MQTNDPVMEAPEANFMKLVQGLIEDNDGREHFLKVKLILFLVSIYYCHSEFWAVVNRPL